MDTLMLLPISQLSYAADDVSTWRVMAPTGTLVTASQHNAILFWLARLADVFADPARPPSAGSDLYTAAYATEWVVVNGHRMQVPLVGILREPADAGRRGWWRALVAYAWRLADGAVYSEAAPVAATAPIGRLYTLTGPIAASVLEGKAARPVVRVKESPGAMPAAATLLDGAEKAATRYQSLASGVATAVVTAEEVAAAGLVTALGTEYAAEVKRGRLYAAGIAGVGLAGGAAARFL